MLQEFKASRATPDLLDPQCFSSLRKARRVSTGHLVYRGSPVIRVPPDQPCSWSVMRVIKETRGRPAHQAQQELQVLKVRSDLLCSSQLRRVKRALLVCRARPVRKALLVRLECRAPLVPRYFLLAKRESKVMREGRVPRDRRDHRDRLGQLSS